VRGRHATCVPVRSATTTWKPSGQHPGCHMRVGKTVTGHSAGDCRATRVSEARIPPVEVAGNLVQSINNDGSHTSITWGPETFWVAIKTSLPVAITASADGRRVVIFQYADWDSPAVRFPTGRPS